MTRKTKSDVHGPKLKLDDKPSKPVGSQSVEPSRSKKRKVADLTSSSPKAPRSTLDHVRKFLKEASEQELDMLSEFLRNRKESVSRQRGGEAKSDLQTHEVRLPAEADTTWRREVASNNETKMHTAKVARRITAQGLE